MLGGNVDVCRRLSLAILQTVGILKRVAFEFAHYVRRGSNAYLTLNDTKKTP